MCSPSGQRLPGPFKGDRWTSQGRAQLEEAWELAQAFLQLQLPWLQVPVAVPVAPLPGVLGPMGAEAVSDELPPEDLASSEL